MSAAAPVPATGPAMLSGEFAPVLLRQDAAVIVFEIGSVQVIATAPDGIETGLLHGHVAALLRAGRPGGIAAGAALLVPFSRAHAPMVRPRQGFNLWNLLELAPGARLALAGHAAPTMPGSAAHFVAEAGATLSASGAVTEPHLRAALEHAGDVALTARGLRGALATALQQHDAISRDVLLLQATEGGAIARLPAIEALRAVLQGLPAGTDARLLIQALGSSPLYDSGLGADPGNALVLDGLASRLHHADQDADLVILTLAGCVLGHFVADPAEDAAIRHRLIAEAFRDVPALLAALRRAAAPLAAPVRARAAALAEALR